MPYQPVQAQWQTLLGGTLQNFGETGGGRTSVVTSFEETDNQKNHEAQVCVLFLFAALTLGTFTKTVLQKYVPSVPYTCVLLFEGVVLGYVHNYNNHGDGEQRTAWGESIQMWLEINPHVLLFTFLPPLLFGESMGMNWHLIKKSFWQCLLLACPGVLLGAVLTALAAKKMFPYEWDWPVAMTFGSILAATDPVAVVAILNELGASPKLTMLISGESLMNDGTAIVLFNLCKLFINVPSEGPEKTTGDHEASESPTLGPWYIIGYFLKMAVGGVGLGIGMGFLALLWMSTVIRKSSHSDAIVQMSITLCCAYLVFFVGEFLAGVSGVLATVAAAITVGAFGWPLFADRETMGQVWHIIEHCGNTVIFMLAGLIMGAKTGRNLKEHLELEDFGRLLVLYVIVTLIRFGMVGLFMPLLMRCGYGLTLRDAVVLSWGGLRGAVGLALALEIDLELNHNKSGVTVLFHVGGIAVLTLMVNGMTSRPLLRYLGMTTPSHTEEALVTEIEQRIQMQCEEVLTAQVERRDGFTVSQQAEVRARCTVLQTGRLMSDDVESHFQTWFKNAETEARLIAVREMFLQALRCAYLDQIEQGLLPKRGPQTVLLTESVDVAMDHVHDGLCTHMLMKRKLRLHRPWTKFVNMICCAAVKNMLVRLGLLMSQRLACFMLLSFIDAHREAQQLVTLNLGQAEHPDTSEQQQVVSEAEQEVAKALQSLQQMDPALVSEVTTQQVCGVVLEQECLFIDKLCAQGVLQDKQAHHLLQQVQCDMKGVSRKEWKHTHRRSQQVELTVHTSSSSGSRSEWPQTTAKRDLS